MAARYRAFAPIIAGAAFHAYDAVQGVRHNNANQAFGGIHGLGMLGPAALFPPNLRPVAVAGALVANQIARRNVAQRHR